MRRPVRSVITEDVAEHPAVEAWTRVDILPHLSLPTPRYYGCWFDEAWGWLLLEDVSGERYRRDDTEHRRLASQWVGALHASATGLDAARVLPDAGPARYLEHLRQGREKVRRAVEAVWFPEDEIVVLQTVVSCLDAVEADWTLVEGLCRHAPDTLVHGDIQPKNLLPKDDGNGQVIRAIDWEMVGFGCPAADLTWIDLEHYWPVVRPVWPDMTHQEISRLATAGHLLQALAQVDWLTAWFTCEEDADRRRVVPRFMPLIERLGNVSRSIRSKQ